MRYLDESIDPDLDWACRMTLLEMNTDPALVNHICHTLTYESVVRLCFNDGQPLTESVIKNKKQKKLTVASVKALANLTFKRWKHINLERAALKAADKAKELAKQATRQGRKKAASAARAAARKWRQKSNQFKKDEKRKSK